MVIAAALVPSPQQAPWRRRRRQGLGRDCTEPSFHDDDDDLSLAVESLLANNARRSGRPAPAGVKKRQHKARRRPANHRTTGARGRSRGARLRGVDGADTLLARPRVRACMVDATPALARSLSRALPSTYERSELNVTLPFQLHRLRTSDGPWMPAMHLDRATIGLVYFQNLL